MATILIGGASGFIGARLAKSLANHGHRIVPLVRVPRRHPLGRDSVQWDPEGGTIDRDGLARVHPDAVVNLAGEPIAKRWSATRKQRIRDSRVIGTQTLAAAVAGLRPPPRVLIGGSAIGIYGAHRGDEMLDESSPIGTDFLARLASEWERATDEARSVGIRVVTVRMGIVLGPDGGALARMLLPFRLGIGGRLGSGRQWMSWISLEDAARAIIFAIETSGLTDAVNVVAPDPVRNAEFTRVLARLLRRPALIPVPAFALRLLFGEMVDNTVLADQRVSPKKLAGAGFEFRHPRLEDALRYELRRSNDPAGR